jgi:Flp pilus assembly protein TadG
MRSNPVSTERVTEKAGASRLALARAGARRENGQGLVEFALVLPVLVLLIVGMVKLGIVYNNYLTLNDAVRAGARQLALGRATGDACTPATNRVKKNAQATLDVTKLVIDPPVITSSCTDLLIGSDATMTAHYPCSIKIPPFINITLTCNASTTERVE